MRNPVCISLLALTGAVVAGAPAFAHITLETREAPAGSYYKAVFSVPHGCAGSATTKIRVRIPEGVVGVKAQPKPGWKLETIKEKLAKPIAGEGGRTITEGVTEIAWSGGKLLDENFDQFVMQVRLPDTPATTLYFPVVQECEKGINRWIETPATGASGGEGKMPAPSLRLTAKS